MTGTTSVFATHYFMTPSGTPAAGGLLHVYSANTTSNMPSWADKAQTTLNTNPITLDGQGQCTLWLEAGQVYDLVLKDNPLGTLTGTPGATIRTYEDVSGATSAVIAPSQWVSTALIPTYIGTRQFSVVGDQTALFTVGRRVRMTSPTTTRYATVISSVFSTVTTVTVGFNPANVVDTTISGIDVSLDDTINTAMMLGSGSVIDLTGYTGADVALGVGQSAVYDVSAITSLLLRLVAGDNQEFEIKFNPTVPAGVVAGGVATLSVNNTALGATVFTAMQGFNSAAGVGATVQGGSMTQTGTISLGVGVTELGFLARVCTRTIGKTSFSTWIGRSSTNNFAGYTNVFCSDITTVITSLGTLTFGNAVTGRIMVRRLM